MSFLAQLEKIDDCQKWVAIRKWMAESPIELYAELRRDRPILELPDMYVATRFEDCTAVLRQHDVFTVALYKPKQGDFWMAQDDTPGHWREKGLMQAVMDLEGLPSLREFVASKMKSILAEANGQIEAVNEIGRAIPIAVVQEIFGFDESDANDLTEWSYWNQYDAFHNQPWDRPFVEDPEAISSKRVAANQQLGQYVGALLQRRGAEIQAGNPKQDIPTRLLMILGSKSIKIDPTRIAQNVGGLLIGAVETTSHASINSIYELLTRPEVFAKAKAAAEKDDTTEFDGYVFEALRFKPAFPYMFRYCEKETRLGLGTQHETSISANKAVIAIVHSAMLDPASFPDPSRFNPARPLTNTFHFGQGLHECLGRHPGTEMIAEIVRQLVLLPNIKATSEIDRKGGPVPERFFIEWDQNAIPPLPGSGDASLTT